jgi:hypothetical protein
MEQNSSARFTNRKLSQLARFWHKVTFPVFGSRRIKTKLQALRRENPWPDISALDGRPSYEWSLDGGGRHLIVDLIRERQPKVFLEVGVFVGGSALQWLRNSPDDMTLIAAEPWGKSAEYWVEAMVLERPSWIPDFEPVLALQAVLKECGIYKVALHNLRDFRDRVIPLRIPATTLYGYLRGFVEPDIIYIDATKEREEYVLAHEIFPRSILCGDDWNWRDAKGEFAMRPFVYEVAESRNCDVVAEGATWVLRPREPAASGAKR